MVMVASQNKNITDRVIQLPVLMAAQLAPIDRVLFVFEKSINLLYMHLRIFKLYAMAPW